MASKDMVARTVGFICQRPATTYVCNNLIFNLEKSKKYVLLIARKFFFFCWITETLKFLKIICFAIVACLDPTQSRLKVAANSWFFYLVLVRIARFFNSRTKSVYTTCILTFSDDKWRDEICTGGGKCA